MGVIGEKRDLTLAGIQAELLRLAPAGHNVNSLLSISTGLDLVSACGHHPNVIRKQAVEVLLRQQFRQGVDVAYEEQRCQYRSLEQPLMERLVRANAVVEADPSLSVVQEGSEPLNIRNGHQAFLSKREQ